MKNGWEKPIIEWRESFERNRRAPYGWLSLVGLDFLNPGDNTVGSAKTAQVRLPTHCPPEVGILSLKEEYIIFAPSPSANIYFRNASVTEPIPLTAEEEDAVLEVGNVRFYVLRRGDGFCVRIKDPAAPSRQGYKGMQWFDPKPEWVMSGRFCPSEHPETIEFPNALGGIDRVLVPGAVEFTLGNQTHLLWVQGSQDSGFFIVFGDDTNGRETYPPGRFLWTASPRDNNVILDFNRAVSPPCALTDFATCPYPPAKNRLALPIEAGERFSR